MAPGRGTQSRSHAQLAAAAGGRCQTGKHMGDGLPKRQAGFVDVEGPHSRTGRRPARTGVCPFAASLPAPPPVAATATMPPGWRLAPSGTSRYVADGPTRPLEASQRPEAPPVVGRRAGATDGLHTHKRRSRSGHGLPRPPTAPQTGACFCRTSAAAVFIRTTVFTVRNVISAAVGPTGLPHAVPAAWPSRRSVHRQLHCHCHACPLATVHKITLKP